MYQVSRPVFDTIFYVFSTIFVHVERGDQVSRLSPNNFYNFCTCIGSIGREVDTLYIFQHDNVGFGFK